MSAALIEEVLSEVRALRREVESLRKPKPEVKLLSLRQAAARLGISRGSTLNMLIERGLIQTVPVRNRTKIPITEVERIEREGFDLDAPAPGKKRRVSAATKAANDNDDLASKIAALRIPRSSAS